MTQSDRRISVLIAPALGGLLLGISGPGAVFAVMGGLVLLAAVTVAPVTGPPPNPRTADRPFATVAEGFRVVAKEPAARLLVGMLGAEYAALGMPDVLYVVLALDLLDIGQSGAGYLNAVFGLGGALAIGVTVSLVGRARLMPALLASLAVWTAAFALLSAWPAAGTAFLALAVAGRERSSTSPGARCSSAPLPLTCSRASSASWRASRWPRSHSARWWHLCWSPSAEAGSPSSVPV